MNKNLRGDGELKHIKLGAGRVLQGQADGTTFAGTTKIDWTAIAAGWRDLGVIMQDVTLSLTKDEFAFRSGVPSTRKKTFIVARDGKITVNFDEFNALLAQLSMGLTSPVNKLSGSEFLVTSWTAATGVLVLDSTTGLSVGDEVVAASATGGLAGSNDKGLILTVDSGTQVTLRPDAKFYGTVVGGWKVKEVASTKLSFGGNAVKTYPLLFVVDLVDPAGVTIPKQIVYLFPKVSSEGNYSPNLGSGRENMRHSISFDAYGQNDTDLGDIALAHCFIFEAES